MMEPNWEKWFRLKSKQNAINLGKLSQANAKVALLEWQLEEAQEKLKRYEDIPLTILEMISSVRARKGEQNDYSLESWRDLSRQI